MKVWVPVWHVVGLVGASYFIGVATGRVVKGDVTITPVPRIKWRQTFVVEGRMAICECGWRQELDDLEAFCPKCGIAGMVSERS